MNEELKRLEQFGLLKISGIKSNNVECKLSENCIRGILNSVKGVYTGQQPLNRKRKKKLVLDSIKDMIQQINFCDGNCSSCDFYACKIIFEIWEQMEQTGQVKLKTGMVFRHHTLLTLSIIEKKVKEAFKKDGFILSTILTPDKIYEIPPFENKLGKEETYKALREIIQNENPKRYWFVSNVWFGDNMFVSPSIAKDRKERVMITEFNRDDPKKDRIVFYDYDLDNHVLVNREEPALYESVVRCNFYLEDTMEERRQQYLKEKLAEWIYEHEKSIIEDAKKFLGSNDTEYVVKNIVETLIDVGRFPPGFFDKYKLREDEEK